MNITTDFVMVRSESDNTLVVNIPDLQLHRTWKKRGQEFPFERRTLAQAFYDPSVEYLFKNGLLTTDDKQFKSDMGLMNGEEDAVVLLTDAQKQRIIKLMPLVDAKKALAELNRDQIEELTEYAIEHYKELKMDRVDILSKLSGKNVLAAINNYKKGLED